MISEEFKDFLLAYYNADEDPQDADKTVVQILQQLPQAAQADLWETKLHDEMSAAIKSNAFTPEVLEGATGRRFEDQQEVDTWLRERWQAWFGGEAYPTA